MRRSNYLCPLLPIALLLSVGSNAKAQVLLSDAPVRLMSNEFAFFNKDDSRALHDPVWDVASGTLFLTPFGAYTGIPDRVNPNPTSSNGTDSAVARYSTKRSFTGSLSIECELFNVGLYPNTGSTIPDVDGIHLWARLRRDPRKPDDYVAYVITINRRSNQAVIKRKYAPGANDYYEISPYVPFKVPYKTWQNVRVVVRDNADGSVYLALYIGGAKIVDGTDRQRAGYPAPATQFGAVGLRGDHCEFYFRNFRVGRL